MSCKHDHWHVADSHPIGQCYCDDCGKFIGLAQAFDRLRERAEAMIDGNMTSAVWRDLVEFRDTIRRNKWPLANPKLASVYNAILHALEG